jgi:pimeloyl-ACP methyl ester carboxylesterase
LENIILQTEDHVRISVDSFKRGLRPTLIVAPGFFQHKQSLTFRRLTEALFKEFNVVIFDFRGHGLSTGAFGFSAHEVKDLEAVVDFVRQEDVPLGIVGFSLGAATSAIYASQVKNVQSLALISTPTAFEDIRMKFWSPEAMRIGLRSLKEGGRVWPGWLFHEKCRPIDVVGALDNTHVLFLHGHPDPIIDASHSTKLFEKAVCKSKKIEIIPGASHGEEMFLKFPDQFTKLVTNWFKSTLN